MLAINEVSRLGNPYGFNNFFLGFTESVKGFG